MGLRSHCTVLVPPVLRARVARLPALWAASFESIAPPAGMGTHPGRRLGHRTRIGDQVSCTLPDSRFALNLQA